MRRTGSRRPAVPRRVAAGIPFRVRPAALAEPDMERYTIRLPARAIRGGGEVRRVKQISCVVMDRVRSVSGHVSLIRYLAPGTPSLPPRYQGSPLLWVPPTSEPRYPPPRLLGLSEGARYLAPRPGSPRLPHIRHSSSTGPVIPGGRGVLAISHVSLLPAGVLKPSARSHFDHFGTSTFTAAHGRHSTSLAFVPTHQAPRRRCTCKARYQTRG